MEATRRQISSVAPGLALGVTATSYAPSASAQQAPVLQAGKATRIGRIDFDLGFPSKAAVAKLYNELDSQRACQAYIWGLPIIGFAEWQQSAGKSFGASDLDYVIYLTVEDKLGILMPNATTPYILGFPDLSKTGPLVVDVPPGPSAGGVLDFWQRPITDTGFAGPDKGEGGKYLILPPDSFELQAEGYRVFRSPTFNVFAGHRALDPDPPRPSASTSAWEGPSTAQMQAGKTSSPWTRAWSAPLAVGSFKRLF